MIGFFRRKEEKKPTERESNFEKYDEMHTSIRRLEREVVELRLDMENMRDKLVKKAYSSPGRPKKDENDLNEYTKSGVIPWHSS